MKTTIESFCLSKGLYHLMISIRAETSKDIVAIRHVLEMAFGRASEARLVEALRQAHALVTSFVAVEKEEIVGHIGFSAALIESAHANANVVALAPVAVLSTHHRRGIGSELVRRGLTQCSQLGHYAVLVLGEPAFYQRFGFVKASLHGILCPFDVPDEAFLVAELFPGSLAGHSGSVKYRPEFDLVSG
jgi:putative acetyltransferase